MLINEKVDTVYAYTCTEFFTMYIHKIYIYTQIVSYCIEINHTILYVMLSIQDTVDSFT